VKFNLPLYVMLPRKTIKDKKFILNLNTYRNTHQMILGQAKHIYADIVKGIAPPVYFNCAKVTMTYYHGNKRRVDKSNPLSVIEKFMCDALTDIGYWEDDDSMHVPITVFKWGGVDKDNPRCEVEINEIVKPEA